MDKRRFKISLDKLASYIDSSCSNIVVKWDTPECGDINCFKNEAKTHLIVEVPDYCNDTCFYGVVSCEHPCEGVKSKQIKVCPCTTDTDCKACEECDQKLGYCVDVCPEELFCSDNGCVECDDLNPCPDGKVCNNGSCDCPADRPYDVDGVCMPCTPDTCPPGYMCTSEGCVIIECSDGFVVHPDTNECVECVTDFHCTGGKICTDNGCVCPDGFFDYGDGICVPIGCTSDDECGKCETCDTVNGQCLPKACPDGYFCHPVTGECVEECDCSNPTCGTNSACIPAGNGKCYCSPCSGSCLDGDCGEGCYCDQENQCQVNTCTGSCENGTDCGDGCGCNQDTKQCEPCDSATCTECGTLLGCECVGNTCGDCADGEYVTSVSDCPPGYGLYMGQCVCCSNFPCDQCAGVIGCECADGVNCGGGDNSCADKFEGVVLDCPDEEYSCALEASLELKEQCPCPVITASSVFDNIVFNQSEYTSDIKVELWKGFGDALTYQSLDRLDDTSSPNIADNEMLDDGAIKLCVDVYYDIFDANNNYLDSKMQRSYESPIVSMADIAEYTFQGVPVNSVGSVYQSGIVTRVQVLIKKVDKWRFPNTCEYDEVRTLITYGFRNNTMLDANLGSGTDKIPMAANVTTDDTRYPLFTWYRSIDNVYDQTEIIYQSYIGPVDADGKYVSRLYGPNNWPANQAHPLSDANHEGLLIPNRFYYVQNDCGCESEKAFDFGKVIFCNPCEVNGELQQCGRTLKINTPFEPCSVNQDLTQFTDITGSNYPVAIDAQTKWTLWINGAEITTFVHNGTLDTMVVDGTTNSMFSEYTALNPNEIITEAYLEQNHGEDGQCRIQFELESIDLGEVESTTDCSAGGANKYQLTVPQNQQDGQIVNVSPSGLGSLQSGNWIIDLNKGETTTLIFTYDTGCTIEQSFYEECCSDVSVSVTSSGGCGSNVQFSATASGGTPSYDIVWFENGTEVATGNNYSPGDSSQHTVEAQVTDATGCTAKQTHTNQATDQPDVEFQVTDLDCNNSNGAITVTIIGYDQSVVTTLSYTSSTVSGGQGPSGVLTNWTSGGVNTNIGNINEKSTYTFQTLVVGDCTYQINETVTVNPSSTGSFGLSLNDGPTYCTGDTVNYEITGPAGASFIVSTPGGSGNTSGTIPISGTSGGNSFSGSFIASTGGNITVSENGSNSDCPINSDTEVITVESGIQITVTAECIGGIQTLTFSDSVASVQVTAGSGTPSGSGTSWQIVGGQATEIAFTPLVLSNCNGNNTVDLMACGCAAFDIDLSYTINGGTSTVYDASTPIPAADGDTVVVTVTNPLNCTDYTWDNFTGGGGGLSNSFTYTFNPIDDNRSVIVTCNVNGSPCTTTLPILFTDITDSCTPPSNSDVVLNVGEFNTYAAGLNINTSDIPGFCDSVGNDGFGTAGFILNVAGGGSEAYLTLGTQGMNVPAAVANGVFFEATWDAGSGLPTTFSVSICSTLYQWPIVWNCPQQINLEFASSSPVSCQSQNSSNGSITVSTPTGGDGAPYTYNWVFPDLTPVQTNGPTITGLNQSGTYTVYAEDASGNISQTVTINLSDLNNCNCVEVDLGVDGTFDNCATTVANTGSACSLGNNGTPCLDTCDNWSNVGGTADILGPENNVHGPANVNELAPGFVHNSNFAGALATEFGTREGFSTEITVIAGKCYQVCFDMGSLSAITNGGLIRTSSGGWEVSLNGNTLQTSPVTFDGVGSQSFSNACLNFTAAVSGTVDLIFTAYTVANIDSSGSYMGIDNIVVTQKDNCTDNC